MLRACAGLVATHRFSPNWLHQNVPLTVCIMDCCRWGWFFLASMYSPVGKCDRTALKVRHQTIIRKLVLRIIVWCERVNKKGTSNGKGNDGGPRKRDIFQLLRSI